MGNYRVTLFSAPYLRLYEVNVRSRVRNITGGVIRRAVYKVQRWVGFKAQGGIVYKVQGV